MAPVTGVARGTLWELDRRMIDEEEARVDPREHGGDRHYGETLMYDFAKFMTTLSLLVLGGLLTLSGAARDGDLKLGNIIFVSAAVATAGVLAFTTANAVVEARARGREPASYLPRLMKASMGFIGVGVGGFLAMWLDTLS
jgi:hypothetical protein